MKNLIDPQILADLKREPVTFDRIAEVLKNNPEIIAADLCKIVNINAQRFYSWKNRNAKLVVGTVEGCEATIDVRPVGNGKKTYLPEEKLKLLKKSNGLTGTKRAEFLRQYGLYESDLARWLEKTDDAALVALSTRKVRSDKKTPEQIEIERLKAELRDQEKTIVKLSAIVVAQKKISELLKHAESN